MGAVNFSRMIFLSRVDAKFSIFFLTQLLRNSIPSDNCNNAFAASTKVEDGRVVQATSKNRTTPHEFQAASNTQGNTEGRCRFQASPFRVFTQRANKCAKIKL